MFNNTIEYLLGYSDLKLKKIIFNKDLRISKNNVLKARVQNMERCYSRESCLTFYLSLNKKLDDNPDIKLGEVEIPQIKSQSSKKVKLKVKIPASVEPGGYYLIAKINADKPTEINPDNNLGFKKVKAH